MRLSRLLPAVGPFLDEDEQPLVAHLESLGDASPDARAGPFRGNGLAGGDDDDRARFVL